MNYNSFSNGASTPSWIDKKWINLLSPNLPNFKWINQNTANFRCPICGDSSKNKRKARGYFFTHKGSFLFKCFNGCEPLPVSAFIKNNYPGLYSEYKLDLLREKTGSERPKLESDNINTSTVVNDPIEVIQYDISIDRLSADHEARKYIQGRKIPEVAFSRILYTENFQDWVLNVLKATKYSGSRLPDDKRILLPLKDRKGNIFGVQGRSLDPNSKARYITIKKHDKYPKIFGLENIDITKPILAVEGPIDSLFLPNCIAFCGGDVNVPLNVDASRVYVILDNEPRSKDTIKRMKTAISKGYNVMFWKVPSIYKDVNDMVKLGGYEPRDILKMVKQDSKHGAAATATLSTWKRCTI